MAEQLSTTYGVTVEQPGEYSVKSLSASKPIYVHRSQSGKIDHIGLRLFDPRMMEKQSSPIFFFVERYLLELLLTNTDAAVQDRLRMERIKLSSDLPMSGTYNKVLRNIIDAFNNELSFYVNNIGNRYTLRCMDGQRNILSLEFPARHELITGFTKLEAENSIYQQMLMHKPTPSTEVVTSFLNKKDSGLYTANEDYYMMENIVSTLYYEKSDDTYRLIFTQNRPTESICNLLNSDIDFGAVVEVTQSLYGNKNHTYEVPLRQLTSFLRSQGCTLYTAFQRIEGNNIFGTLMAINPELGYQHMLTFTLDKSIISQIKVQPIKMKMFSYVPIHNITSIMEGNKL